MVADGADLGQPKKFASDAVEGGREPSRTSGDP
jgi:hypothetical protein